MSNQFFHLEHEQIDRIRWDECVQKAHNSRIFAYSWYLDIFCDKWECITNHDYSVIFPLQVKRKKFIHYIALPMILQQSGPYAVHPITEEMLNELIDVIPSKYKYIEYRLTEECAPYNIGETKLSRNCKLKLSLPYDELYANYSKSHRKNIRRGLRNNLVISDDIAANTLLDMIIDNGVRGGVEGLTDKDYQQVGSLFEIATANKAGIYKAVYTTEGELCAGAFFLTIHPVTTFFFGATEIGRENKAVFILIDAFIKQYAGQERILDFSGSNVENIAYFFNGFGATCHSYPIIKINKLPLPLKLLKK